MPLMLTGSKDQAYIYTPVMFKELIIMNKFLNMFLIVWLPGRLISGWNQIFHTFWNQL